MQVLICPNKAMTGKKNAHFLDYDCSTGVWMFQVENF
jgi:hypothetical protein